MQYYSVKKLAVLAGISVRTLHFYDETGLLKPGSYTPAGYRLYGQHEILKLQQILFFRELGFNLKEIKQIVTNPDFNILAGLQSQRELLEKKIERMQELKATVEKSIQQLKGEISMDIKDFYQGFSDEQIEKYREEVRHRWGEETLQQTEERLVQMGKTRFIEIQSEGGGIFQAIAAKMEVGYSSPEVQNLVAQWRLWLEHFSHYSAEAVLGLGRMYSQHPDFAAFYRKIHPELPEFLTRAIEYYCNGK